jgi:glycosyltransferase involved in cell wall biosynthesis
MKVLHIITSLSTGGAEHALYNVLSGGLAKSGQAVVVSLRDEGTYGQHLIGLGVPVYTLEIRRGLPGLKAITLLRRLVREFQPDVIQGWMYHGNLAASLAGRMAPGYPAVAWNVRHSLYSLADEKFLTQQVIRMNQRLSSRVDAILYNSHISRKQHEVFGFAQARGRVISNGFDVDVIHPSSTTRGSTLCAMSIPKSAQVIGHVARFHPMKDHATFLKAAVQVAIKLPQVRFLVVGRGVDLVNPALVGIVPTHLVDRFHFLGERDDVPVLMQAMDVLCTSSAWGEAFPNVLGEAMATGIPCVATDVGDSSVIIGDTGIVVPPSDSQALAQGLLAMLSKTGDERQALGSAARQRVVANYTLPTIVNEYKELYAALMKRKQ